MLTETIGKKMIIWHDKPKILSPFRINITGEEKKQALKIHKRRSKRSRVADESFNAPLTLDFEKWKQKKNRLDYPFVDTIPPSRLWQRAKRITKKAKQKGIVHLISIEKLSSKKYRGQFFPTGKPKYKTITIEELYKQQGRQTNWMSEEIKKQKTRIKTISGKPEVYVYKRAKPFTLTQKSFILSHEIGHAFEWARPKHLPVTEVLMKALSKSREISEYMRGRITGYGVQYAMYRASSHELFADLFASYVLQPRATKRMFKEGAKLVEDVYKQVMGKK